MLEEILDRVKLKSEELELEHFQKDNKGIFLSEMYDFILNLSLEDSHD